MIKQDYLTSIRVPNQVNDWISKFADRWGVSKSFVYRSAIREFIKAKGNQQNI